uniref:Uncharacterized protein n=1 Tax=Arundo donax TaxID=35708 RepID=A0A0A9F853_ARUDO
MNQIRINSINPMYCGTGCKRTPEKWCMPCLRFGLHHCLVLMTSRTTPMGAQLPFELLPDFRFVQH